jgi:hypothetical protein
MSRRIHVEQAAAGDPVLVAVDDEGIALVTLNRPDRLNPSAAVTSPRCRPSTHGWTATTTCGSSS